MIKVALSGTQSGDAAAAILRELAIKDKPLKKTEIESRIHYHNNAIVLGISMLKTLRLIQYVGQGSGRLLITDRGKQAVFFLNSLDHFLKS